MSEIASALGLYMQLGLSMAMCVFIGVFLGKKIDNALDTSPVFLLILTFIGAAAAFKVLYDYTIKRWRK